MPIPKRWSAFTKIKLSRVPVAQGIYELGDAKGEVVYIGSSDEGKDIRGRLYFHKNHKPKSVRCFRFLPTGIFESPLAMEQHHCKLFKAKYGRLPRLQKRMPRGYSSLLSLL
jgi:excinuclease UvrABC nuclease subunit